jgi:hypothetical protein
VLAAKNVLPSVNHDQDFHGIYRHQNVRRGAGPQLTHRTCPALFSEYEWVRILRGKVSFAGMITATSAAT